MISITTGNCNALPMIIIICDLLLWQQCALATVTSEQLIAPATATPTTTTTTPIIIITTTTRARTVNSTSTASTLASASASTRASTAPLSSSFARTPTMGVALGIGNTKIIQQTATVITKAPTTTATATPSKPNATKATRAELMDVAIIKAAQLNANVRNAQISLNASQTSRAVATPTSTNTASATSLITARTATKSTTTTTTTTATTHIMQNEMSFHQYCLEHRNTIAPLCTLVLYAIVCMVGLFGNTLVIYVVLRYSKMQTVTNIYILNLAIADECFLIGIPFLLYTMRICSWKFGDFLCKAYMVNTSIPQFTSSIFLLIMSADRYIAVCHPITSPRYRTLRIAKLISALAWCTSVVLMLPVILYASTVLQEDGVNLSCNIDWPETYERQTASTFILYSFLLGFATPLTFILIFYCLVLRKLQAVGVKHKSKEKKRSHRKVTRLVLTVITVYVLCWLPYWISQVMLISSSPDRSLLSKDTKIIVFLLFGCLSYSNSAMNPILYAFLSDNFRKSFSKAFTCMGQHEVNAQLHAEASILTRQGSRKRQHHGRGGTGNAGSRRAEGGADVGDGTAGNALIAGHVHVKPKQLQHQQHHQHQQLQELHHSDQHVSSSGGNGSSSNSNNNNNNNSSSTTTTTSSTATGNTLGGGTHSTVTAEQTATNTTTLSTLSTQLTSVNDSSSSSCGSGCGNSHINNGMLMPSTSPTQPKQQQQQQQQQPENTVLMLLEEQTVCAIMERQRQHALSSVATDPMIQTDL